jgi:hypothetical protein
MKKNFTQIFFRKIKNKRYLVHPLIWCLMTFLMILCFVFLQLKVEKIITLGNVSNDLDWLRNSNNLTIFLRPNEKSEFFLPQNITSFQQRQNIACFVMSAPKNRPARSFIRQTWGNQIKPLFVLGLNDEETMNSVMNEAKIYQDIIIENFIDSYQNLTLKTGFAMKHFLRHFKNSKYFFKIDDDVLLNFDNLDKFLSDEDLPKNSIIGSNGEGLTPHRDRESKWYVPYWLYSHNLFPDFVKGPGYLIPGVKATSNMFDFIYS